MPPLPDQSQPAIPQFHQLPVKRPLAFWLAAVLLAADAFGASGADPHRAELPFADSGMELRSWIVDRGDDIHGDLDIVGVDSTELRVSPRLRSNDRGRLPLGVYQVIDADDYRGHDVAASVATSVRDGAFAVVSITIVMNGGGTSESQASQESNDFVDGELATGLFVPTDATAIIVACRAGGSRGSVTFSDVRLETVSYRPQMLDLANVLGKSLSAAALR